MKYNIFDVLVLKDNTKVIISEINDNKFKVKIVRENEPIKQTMLITEKDIKDVLYKHFY